MEKEDLPQAAEALMSQAKTLRLKDKTEEAIAAYLAAEKLWAQLSDERGRSRCWTAVGKAYFKGQDQLKAVEAFQRSAEYAAAAEWPDKEIEARYNKGLILERIGTKSANLSQVNGAIQAFQQALAVARSINDTGSVGVLLLSLGFNCAWAKRDAEAIKYLIEAVPFALNGVDFDTAFSALSSLGVLLSNQGRGNEAIPYYERALELAKSQQGDIVAVADTYANLGIAYEKAGRLDEAIEAIDTYREILHTVGDVKAGNAQAMLKQLRDKKRVQQTKV